MIRKFKLWILFVCIITTVMISTFFISGFLTFISFRSDPAKFNGPSSWLPLLSLAVTAVLAAVSCTFMISKHFFVPIEQLIAALKQVASGDFKAHLPESGVSSEARDMNINFNKMVKELNSMEMLQSDFIQNVSHEIKTPLSAIEGYATLLNSAPLSDELHTYASRILESTRQLSSLTGNILKLSKLENQQIVSEKSRFSLDEQLRQAVLSLEPLWNGKNLDISIDLPEVEYYGNEDLLCQVWTNLLSNAVKFTPRGGLISVSLADDPGFVIVEIRDSGIGMSEEVKAHVFDKFYQGEQNRSMEGNGLGLALVRKIVELCGGFVIVESSPDQGAAFTVSLPVTEV